MRTADYACVGHCSTVSKHSHRGDHEKKGKKRTLRAEPSTGLSGLEEVKVRTRGGASSVPVTNGPLSPNERAGEVTWCVASRGIVNTDRDAATASSLHGPPPRHVSPSADPSHPHEDPQRHVDASTPQTRRELRYRGSPGTGRFHPTAPHLRRSFRGTNETPVAIRASGADRVERAMWAVAI